VPAVGHAAAALQAARGAEEVQPQAAPQQEAVASVGAAARQREARAAVVRLRVALGALAALPSVLLSALAFRRDQAPPWPAQLPAVRFARATGRMRIASP
jgi:hypothetical protein